MLGGIILKLFDANLLYAFTIMFSLASIDASYQHIILIKR